MSTIFSTLTIKETEELNVAWSLTISFMSIDFNFTQCHYVWLISIGPLDADILADHGLATLQSVRNLVWEVSRIPRGTLCSVLGDI